MNSVNNRLSHETEAPIVVVSGLPRSGTSMVMKMLEAGGIPLLTDGFRKADSDNPNGYFEWERVKKLKQGDTAWLPEARGKAVKVISALLEYLPEGYTYQVVFIHRKMDEILASQRKMLVNRGVSPDTVNEAEMADLFRKHLEQTASWLKRHCPGRHLFLDYNRLMMDPYPEIQKLHVFFHEKLDLMKMRDVIEPGLYRQRK
jgi:hypothetical protein